MGPEIQGPFPVGSLGVDDRGEPVESLRAEVLWCRPPIRESGARGDFRGSHNGGRPMEYPWCLSKWNGQKQGGG